MIDPFVVPYDGWCVFFTHKPRPLLPVPPLSGAGDLNVHGHLHQNASPTPWHLNVSVERLGYRPADSRALLDRHIAALAATRIQP